MFRLETAGNRVHREVRETRHGRDAAAKHLPTTAPCTRAIHEPDVQRLLALRRYAARCKAALIAAGHARAEIALVLDLAHRDCLAGAVGARERLGALSDDDLVVHVLVHHVKLVDRLPTARAPR